MEKRKKTWWKSALVGDAEIDTQKVDSTCRTSAPAHHTAATLSLSALCVVCVSLVSLLSLVSPCLSWWKSVLAGDAEIGTLKVDSTCQTSHPSIAQPREGGGCRVGAS
eukprot:390211-Rhodomonas_salina.1